MNSDINHTRQVTYVTTATLYACETNVDLVMDILVTAYMRSMRQIRPLKSVVRTYKTSTTSMSAVTALPTWQNQYGDLQVSPGALQSLGNDTDQCLQALKHVLSTCKRGIWLRLDWDTQAHLLPIAQQLGFYPHHTYGRSITLHAWRCAGPNPTPQYARMSVGVGAIVVWPQGRILAIREAYDRSGLYHVPGGHLDEGEDYQSGAIREAAEETGAVAYPLGLAAIRLLHLPDTLAVGAEDAAGEGRPSRRSQACRAQYRAALRASMPSWAPTSAAHGAMEHKMRWGPGHTAAFTLSYACTEQVHPDDKEVAEAVWLEPQVFIERAHTYMAFFLACAVESGQVAAASACARRHLESGGQVQSGEGVPCLMACTTAYQPLSQQGTDTQAQPLPPLPVPTTYTHVYSAAVLACAQARVAQAQGGKERALGPVYFDNEAPGSSSTEPSRAQ